MLLFVFSRNKKQLLNIIANSGKGEEDKLLDFFDKAKYWSFVIAVIASVIFVLSLMFKNLNLDKTIVKKENYISEVKMSDKKIEIIDNVPDMEGFSGLSSANDKNIKTAERGFSNIIIQQMEVLQLHQIPLKMSLQTQKMSKQFFVYLSYKNNIDLL